MAGDALGHAEPREDAKRGGELELTVAPLLLERRENRRFRQGAADRDPAVVGLCMALAPPSKSSVMKRAFSLSS